jgi:Anti-sigma factor NepR
MAENTLRTTRKRGAKAGAKRASSPRGPSTGMKQYIAGQLKAMYDEVAAEPIPERFLQLLDRLSSDKEK